MTSQRRRGTSTPSSLMQDVPGAFPAETTAELAAQDSQTHTNLYEAIHARKAEYVRPKHVRIKIGTWNVAAHKGTEKDVGGWFVGGKGVDEALSGFSIGGGQTTRHDALPDPSEFELREDISDQEERYVRKQSTMPHNDPGTLPGNEDIGLYVLALQEVVDITSTTEALRPYADPGVVSKWKDALEQALPEGYRMVAEHQLIGLLLLMYASSEVADDVKSVSTTSVGTGLMGYMGNKGAVTARIVLGDTTRLVFINSHLAAGADKASLERRNWDASQIVQRTRFGPIQDSMDLAQTTGEQIGDEDFAFWMGDLNYRLEGIPGDDVRRLLMLHARNEYDSSRLPTRKIDKEIASSTEAVRRRVDDRLSVRFSDSSSVNSPRPSSEETGRDTDSTAPSTLLDDIKPSEDPTSLQTTISSLLPHDELHQQIKGRKAFYDGWREGPITFLPTYKYDVGSVGVFDSSEKKRAPSWCDRILYRARRDKLAYEAKVKAEESAKKRDEEMQASGTDLAASDEDILYDYDPETDGADAYDDANEYNEHDDFENGVAITRDEIEDELQLEYYTAHQRVLSSDHKPLDAVFALKYDAVVPELKAKVHNDVAKIMDKAENEGRPNVTVVVDQQSDAHVAQNDEDCKDSDGVWFGGVRWMKSKVRSLTVANTSRVPATFSFIERPVDNEELSGVAPSWLNLEVNGQSFTSSSRKTDSVTVEPGDTAAVELTIRIVDMNLVKALNDGIKHLDDVLVLRVEGGRDHFIPVRAKWLDTSLGHSIDKLIRIPEGGIRRLQNQRPDNSRSRDRSRSGSERASPAPVDPVRFSAPRELFRLTVAIEELVTRVVAEWDMTSSGEADPAPWLQHPGWPFEPENYATQSTLEAEISLSEICNALDTDQPLEASLPEDLPRMQRLYVLSSFLLIFLSNIPDGVIDEDLSVLLDAYLAGVEKAKHKPSIEEQRTGIQEILSRSPSRSISFILILTMLERILLETATFGKSVDGPTMSSTSKLHLGTLRRVTGTFVKQPVAPSREQTPFALTKIFTRVVFQTPAKKLNASQEKRRVEVLDIFLKKNEPP